jgi:hypothetical protein
MKSSEFTKQLEKMLASKGIPVRQHNPTSEELQRTIFLFPPKVRTGVVNSPPASKSVEKGDD